MKKKIWFGGFVFVIILTGFSYLSHSVSEVPDIVIVGNPARLSLSIKSSLPTGYKWIAEERPQFAINPTDPNDQRAYFVISPEYNNIDEIMEWSKTSGKKEIYIRFQEPPDPNMKVEPYLDEFFSVLYRRIEVNWLRFFSTTEAWAGAIPVPNCNGNVTFPVGTTQLINCGIYNNPQQRAICAGNCPRSNNAPSIEITYHYQASDCHINSMSSHIMGNVDRFPVEYQLYGNNHPSAANAALSTTYCMGNSHNPSVRYCQPSGLEINVYLSDQEMRNVFNLCGGSGSGAWACATTDTGDGNLNDAVATNKNGIIWIAQNRFRGAMWLIRHELQHTYGFTHGPSPGSCADMTPSGHNTFHCCSSHEYH